MLRYPGFVDFIKQPLDLHSYENKVFTRLMTVLLLVVMVIMAAYPSVAYAQVDEKEAAQETLKEEPKKPEITVIKKEEEKEVQIALGEALWPKGASPSVSRV